MCINKHSISFLFLLCCCTLLPAQNQNCEKLKYTYDATGNRILRQFTIQPCGQNARMAGNEGQEPQTIHADNTLLQVYPNPASDMLYVQSISEQTISELHLYDANGKLLAVKKTNHTSGELPVHTLSKGIYYLHVHMEEKPHIYRIIKH